jgi:hypothetical protein
MRDARDPIARLKDRARRSGWGVAIDETMAFTQPELAALFDLWRAKAEASQSLPRREDLDIRLLKPFVRHVAVMERVGAVAGRSRYRIRLQGSFLVQYYGDQTGRLMDEAFPPDLAERWAGVNDALLEARRPVRVVGAYRHEKLDHMIGEALLLPLGNGDAAPVSVLSVTYYTPSHTRKG